MSIHREASDHHVQQALGLHAQGRLDEAEGIYRQILTENPQNPDALHYLGVLMHRLI